MKYDGVNIYTDIIDCKKPIARKLRTHATRHVSVNKCYCQSVVSTENKGLLYSCIKVNVHCRLRMKPSRSIFSCPFRCLKKFM